MERSLEFGIGKQGHMGKAGVAPNTAQILEFEIMAWSVVLLSGSPDLRAIRAPCTVSLQK